MHGNTLYDVQIWSKVKGVKTYDRVQQEVGLRGAWDAQTKPNQFAVSTGNMTECEGTEHTEARGQEVMCVKLGLS